jgi:hypothetical protein
MANFSQLDSITNALEMHRPGIELDTYLKTHAQSLPPPPAVPTWHTSTILVLMAVTILNLFCLWILPYALKLIKIGPLLRTPIGPTVTPERSQSTPDAKTSDPTPAERYVRQFTTRGKLKQFANQPDNTVLQQCVNAFSELRTNTCRHRPRSYLQWVR